MNSERKQKVMKTGMKRFVWLALLAASLGGFDAHAFYNPNVGRWLSRDPIGESGDTNLYMTVQNGPQNAVDALGKQTVRQPYPPPTGHRWDGGESCMQFALNRIGPNSDIPGADAGNGFQYRYDARLNDCTKLRVSLLASGKLRETDGKGACDCGFRKVAYLVGYFEGFSDWHFMREDFDGNWEHKFRKSSPELFPGQLIINQSCSFPARQRQGPAQYKVCGFLCAPE